MKERVSYWALLSSKLRLSSAVICMVGVTALIPFVSRAAEVRATLASSSQAEVAQEKAATRALKRNRCEPITKACIYQSTTARETSRHAVVEDAVVDEGALAPVAKHRRCEPITKACIYRSPMSSSAVAEKKLPAPAPASKRTRCEPITKACIYR